jgi:hypothetical protein
MNYNDKYLGGLRYRSSPFWIKKTKSCQIV